ncbi:MAG: abortive infection family protein [Tepidisphaeraceae bacterium]
MQANSWRLPNGGRGPRCNANRLSDAHGRRKTAARPLARHAELAVNLAGAMATFLVATLEARKTDSK